MTKPMWMEYADLATKVAVPVAVLVATVWYNSAAESRRRSDADAQEQARLQQNCLDNQFKLTSALCQDEACTMTGRRATYLVHLSSTTGQMCNRAGLEIPAVTAEGVSTAVAATGDATKAGAVAANLGLTPQTTEVSREEAPRIQAAPAVRDINPRLYIQYPQGAQRASVDQLIARLEGAQLGGRPIVVPPPDRVATAVSRTQVRCMKHADCEQVRELAGFLTVLLGEPVEPVDLSARYERSTRARPRHYELWLAPGPLNVQAPAQLSAAGP